MPTLQRKQKRKVQSILLYSLLSLSLAFFVFGGCLGVHYWKIYHPLIVSPLALAQQQFAAMNTSGLHTKIIDELSKHHITYTTVTVNSNSTATIQLPQDGLVTIATNKDILQQITSLQLTIANLTIEGKQLKRMDFRFDKPVVVF